MRRKWHFGRGLWRIFPIKKYPSTIRWENGVLISHFCAYFLENFLALTIRWKKRVLIPPFALKNCRKFCSLLYAGKTGFLHPPPAHIFQKNFCPSLYAAKIAIYQPLAEDFVQKNLPFTIRWKNRLLATPLFWKKLQNWSASESRSHPLSFALSLWG